MHEDGGPVRRKTREALDAADLDARTAGVQEVMLRLADAIDAIDANGINPAGKLDNVSIPSYLKYAQALGLVDTPNMKRRTTGKNADGGDEGEQEAAPTSALAQLRALPGGRDAVAR